MLKRPKISVVGAGGNVGAAVVQWGALRELGEWVCLDLRASVAAGRAIDVGHCSPLLDYDLPFIAGDDPSLMQDSDVVVITAGVPRKPGQSREELIGVNASIVRDICLNVKQYAPQSQLIVVSNPLDAMVYVAKAVTGFPRHRVMGSAGALDSSRFRYNIAQAVGCSVKDVQAIVLGAHTDQDMVPIVSTATVGGVPLRKLLAEDRIQTLVEKTKKNGAELIHLIGTSAWLAAGNATVTMVESLVRDQKRVIPCSVELQGEFGVIGTFVGVPTILDHTGVSRICEIDLDPAEQAAFQRAIAVNQDLMAIAQHTLSAQGDRV